MKKFDTGRAARARLFGRVAAALLFAASLCAARAEFMLDDVHFWVGEGTNRAAVVVDWSEKGQAPLAWGYRWNGKATATDAILAVNAEDDCLDAAYSQSEEYGFYLSGFAYRPQAGEPFEVFGEDYYGATASTGTYWSISYASPGGDMAPAQVGASSLVLDPGGRLGLKWTYYSFDYVTYDYDGGDTSVAEDAAVAAPVTPFSMDGIHFWVGSGTNRAALVVDFSAEGFTPRAWGFRWNGTTNLTELVKAIDHEDPRFSFYADPSQADTFAAAFSYDLADVASSFHLASGMATDPDAWFPVPRSVTEGNVKHGWFWNIVKGIGASFEDVPEWTGTSSMDSETLADGTWYLFRTNWYTWDAGTWQYEEGSPEVRRPRPAESPYGWRVAAALLNPTDAFSRADAALGRPAVDAPSYTWNGTVYPPSPVHPGVPASRPDALVSLTSPDEGAGILGSIAIEFDHPVVDDPRNPFGIDFIVFGNALQTLGGNAEALGTDDPATVVFGTASVEGEDAVVSVSQDGENWFAFTNGPTADDFAPTLGRLYDPDHPDPALFEGTDFTNKYWGRPAHATIPVDPKVGGADFKGRTLADYARLYNGSAGGTGFDIGPLPLPPDAKGRKWIKFVKIEAPEAAASYAAAPEIDAVADVAPAPSFRNWVDAYVAFTNRPGFAKTTVCSNGAPAYLNAAFWCAPDAPAPSGWAIEGFDPATRTLAVPFAPFAYDLVSLESATDLVGGAWTPSLPLWLGTDDHGHPLLRAQDETGVFFRPEVHE